MSILKKCIRKALEWPMRVVSQPIRKSQWYDSLFVDSDGEAYPNNDWYRRHDERNYDMVVLGSSSAKWGVDFSAFNIKGMNWAQAPQTLVEDYNILRNFHSILRKGGYVLITIMPFTSLNKQTGVKDALKYMRVPTHEPIEPYLREKAFDYYNYPVLFGKQAVKAGVRYLLGRESPLTDPMEVVTNPMTKEQLEHHAKGLVDGWKKQFGIENFDAPLTEENRKARAFRVELLQEIIDFCLERDYVPVLLIPPMSCYVTCYFSTIFEQTYIYGFLDEVDRDVRVLDYSKDTDLKNEMLYFNSFLLNKTGRNALSRKILVDLNLI